MVGISQRNELLEGFFKHLTLFFSILGGGHNLPSQVFVSWIMWMAGEEDELSGEDKK